MTQEQGLVHAIFTFRQAIGVPTLVPKSLNGIDQIEFDSDEW